MFRSKNESMFSSSTNSGLALVLTAMVLCTQAFATDGTWDPTWIPHPSVQKGIPGLFEDTWNLGGTGIFAGSMTVSAIAVQNDGKVVVAGFGWNTADNGDQNACVLRRYNVNGSVDASFGSGGARVINWNNGSEIEHCYFKAIVLQADGRSVAAGQIISLGGEAQGIVQRFNSNGSSDGGFNDSSIARLGIGTDASGVKIVPHGDVLVAGSHKKPGFTDLDFALFVLGADGSDKGQYFRAFDQGGNNNDIATSLAVQSYSFFGFPNWHHSDNVYLVGVVDKANYASGQLHRSCGVVALQRTDDSAFSFDTTFNGIGQLAVDFPVGLADTDTICRAAIGGPDYFPLPIDSGVVVGGERYFTPPGAPLGSASYYALAEIDDAGTVTRHDDSGYFLNLNAAGAYNSINGFVRDYTGNLVTVGYAGIGVANSPADHAPADGVIRRFNADFSVDSSFGNFGTVDGSLDTSGVSGILPNQREWFTSIAYDGFEGRIVVAGERSLWLSAIPYLYSWFLGAVRDTDRIFADGFDG